MNWRQKALLQSIRKQDFAAINAVLDSHPDILKCIGEPFTTPLHEAIKTGNIDLVKLLVRRGADVNFPARASGNPLDLAVRKHRDDIVLYLKSKKAVSAEKKPVPVHPLEEEKIYFTVKALPNIFSPEKWVGHVREMAALWEQVPIRLKEKFDFSSAYSNARQRTLKQNHPKKDVFKKPPPL